MQWRRRFVQRIYCLYNTASAVRKWKKCFPKLNEGTVRRFWEGYESLMKKTSRKKKSFEKQLVKLRRGCPTLLGGKFDNLVQIFLKATRYKEGVVNSTITTATAKPLTKRYPLLEKDNIVLEILWAKILFRRMGFVLCKVVSGKVAIPVLRKKQSWNSYKKSRIRLRNIKFLPHWW